MPTDPARILVDTTVVSILGKGKGRHAEWAEVIKGRRPFISFVTVGEILAGAASSNWGPATLALWEDILRAYTVIPGTVDIARSFGPLRARFKGQMDDDDLWIAATALAIPDLELATADSDYTRIAEVFPLRLAKPPR